jgi:heptosyltransferase-2
LSEENRAQLVIQTAFPGDLLLSIPLLKQIRILYPKNPIVLVCRPGLGEFFLTAGLVDELAEMNKRNKAEFKAEMTKLKKRQWARIFCPHQSFRSALMVRSLKVHEFSVGFAHWWNFFAFSKRMKKPLELPDALRQLSLLCRTNASFKKKWESEIVNRGFENTDSQRDFNYAQTPTIPDWASMRAARKDLEVVSGGRPIFIAPGSVWPTKRWTEEGFAELAKTLVKKGHQVVFVGSAGESAICERLATQSGTVSVAGKTTLAGLIDLFRSGQALVANDSGAMHAASVAGLPCVAVFGPTVLKFGFRPWQNQAVVAQVELACRPCATHGGQRCPIKTHACMTAVQANHLEKLLMGLISKS